MDQKKESIKAVYPALDSAADPIPAPTAPLPPKSKPLPSARVLLSCCNATVLIPLIRDETYLQFQSRLHKERTKRLEYASEISMSQYQPCPLLQRLLAI